MGFINLRPGVQGGGLGQEASWLVAYAISNLTGPFRLGRSNHWHISYRIGQQAAGCWAGRLKTNALLLEATEVQAEKLWDG
jgi:hypothetical protein